MNPRLLRTAIIGCSILTSTAFAQSAFAQRCGDGIWQRLPSDLAIVGEQCDMGDKSVNSISYNGSQLSGCQANCTLRPLFVGNGILETYTPAGSSTPIWEECDDGNHFSGDLCSAEGRFEDVYPYGETAAERCGNGILDSGEMCDAGLMSLPYHENHNAGACQADCSRVGRLFNEKGYVCTSGKLCGNGVVDRQAGEECDNGADNGKEGVICTEFCTLARYNPTFQPGLVESVGGTATSGHLDIAGTLPTLLTDSSVIYSNRGRTLTFPYTDGKKQYSGIIRAGQKVDDGVDVRLTMRPADEGYMWDNDAFGLVFGIKQGDSSNTHADYIMLSWRNDANDGNRPNKGGTTQIFPDDCNGPVQAAQRGLRLYRIQGTPSYNELWKMESCNSNHITEIDTKTISVFNKLANPAYTLRTWYTWDLGIDWLGRNPALQMRVKFTQTGLEVWVNFEKVIDIDANTLDWWPKDGEWGFYLLGMDNVSVDFSGYQSRVRPPNNRTDFVHPDENALGTFCGYCGDGITQRKTHSSLPLESCDDKNFVSGDGCNSDCQIQPGWSCDTNTLPSQCFTGTIVEPIAETTFGVGNIVVNGTFDGEEPDHIEVVVRNGSQVEVCSGHATIISAAKTWSYSCPATLSTGSYYSATATFTKGTGLGKGELIQKTTFHIDTDAADIRFNQPSPSKFYINEKANRKYIKGGCEKNGDADITEERPVYCNFPYVKGSYGNGKNPDSMYAIVKKIGGDLYSDKQPHSFIFEPTNTWIFSSIPNNLEVPQLEENCYVAHIYAERNSKTNSIQKEFCYDKTAPQNQLSIVDSHSGNILKDENNTSCVGDILKIKNGKITLSGQQNLGGEGSHTSPLRVHMTLSLPTGGQEDQVADIDPQTGNYLLQFDVPAKHTLSSKYNLTTTVVDKAGNASTSTTCSNIYLEDESDIYVTPVVTIDPIDGSQIPTSQYTIQGKSTPGTVGGFKVELEEKEGKSWVNKTTLTSSRSGTTGQWTTTEKTFLTGKVYRVTVSVNHGAKTFTYDSTFSLDQRDISSSTLTFVQANELTLNNEGKLEIQVQASGATVRAGDRVEVRLQGSNPGDPYHADLTERCTLAGNPLTCTLFVTPNAAGTALSQSITLTGVVKAGNGTHSSPVRQPSIIKPQVHFNNTRVPNGSRPILQGRIEGNSPVGMGVKVVVCKKLGSTNHCEAGSESPLIRATVTGQNWVIPSTSYTYTFEDNSTYLVLPYASFPTADVFQPHNAGELVMEEQSASITLEGVTPLTLNANGKLPVKVKVEGTGVAVNDSVEVTLSTTDTYARNATQTCNLVADGAAFSCNVEFSPDDKGKKEAVGHTATITATYKTSSASKSVDVEPQVIVLNQKVAYNSRFGFQGVISGTAPTGSGVKVKVCKKEETSDTCIAGTITDYIATIRGTTWEIDATTNTYTYDADSTYLVTPYLTIGTVEIWQPYNTGSVTVGPDTSSPAVTTITLPDSPITLDSKGKLPVKVTVAGDGAALGESVNVTLSTTGTYSSSESATCTLIADGANFSCVVNFTPADETMKKAVGRKAMLNATFNSTNASKSVSIDPQVSIFGKTVPFNTPFSIDGAIEGNAPTGMGVKVKVCKKDATGGNCIKGSETTYTATVTGKSWSIPAPTNTYTYDADSSYLITPYATIGTHEIWQPHNIGTVTVGPDTSTPALTTITLPDVPLTLDSNGKLPAKIIVSGADAATGRSVNVTLSSTGTYSSSESATCTLIADGTNFSCVVNFTPADETTRKGVGRTATLSARYNSINASKSVNIDPQVSVTDKTLPFNTPFSIDGTIDGNAPTGMGVKVKVCRREATSVACAQGSEITYTATVTGQRWSVPEATNTYTYDPNSSYLITPYATIGTHEIWQPHNIGTITIGPDSGGSTPVTIQLTSPTLRYNDNGKIEVNITIDGAAAKAGLQATVQLSAKNPPKVVQAKCRLTPASSGGFLCKAEIEPGDEGDGTTFGKDVAVQATIPIDSTDHSQSFPATIEPQVKVNQQSVAFGTTPSVTGRIEGGVPGMGVKVKVCKKPSTGFNCISGTESDYIDATVTGDTWSANISNYTLEANSTYVVVPFATIGTHNFWQPHNFTTLSVGADNSSNDANGSNGTNGNNNPGSNSASNAGSDTSSNDESVSGGCGGCSQSGNDAEDSFITLLLIGVGFVLLRRRQED